MTAQGPGWGHPGQVQLRGDFAQPARRTIPHADSGVPGTYSVRMSFRTFLDAVEGRWLPAGLVVPGRQGFQRHPPAPFPWVRRPRADSTLLSTGRRRPPRLTRPVRPRFVKTVPMAVARPRRAPFRWAPVR